MQHRLGRWGYRALACALLALPLGPPPQADVMVLSEAPGAAAQRRAGHEITITLLPAPAAPEIDPTRSALVWTSRGWSSCVDAMPSVPVEIGPIPIPAGEPTKIQAAAFSVVACGQGSGLVPAEIVSIPALYSVIAWRIYPESN